MYITYCGVVFKQYDHFLLLHFKLSLNNISLIIIFEKRKENLKYGHIVKFFA